MSLAIQRAEYVLTTQPLLSQAERERVMGEMDGHLAKSFAESGEREKAEASHKNAKEHFAKASELMAKYWRDERITGAADAAAAGFVTDMLIGGDLSLTTVSYLAWSRGYFAKPPNLRSLRKLVHRHWRGLKKRGPKGGQK